MRSNGSIYVSVVFAVLVGYFSYQWWFNPHRVVKRRLGELAATLSVPASETELGRVARLAQLRHYLAESIHIRTGRSGPELSSRDAVMAAASGWTPQGGWNVDFVDVDVRVDSDTAARAFVTAGYRLVLDEPDNRPDVLHFVAGDPPNTARRAR